MANSITILIIQVVSFAISIVIIEDAISMYKETKNDLDPLQEFDAGKRTRLLLSSPNYSFLENNVRISNYCQWGEEILSNICTEEQIIKGCYDITPNEQKNLLRSLTDQSFCAEVKAEIDSGKKISEIFTLNYKTVSKMALGISVIIGIILGILVFYFIMFISVYISPEGALCFALKVTPILLIVAILSGITNIILFIIMVVKFYKGRTTGEFIDFYDDCLSFPEKEKLTEVSYTLKRINRNYDYIHNL